MSVSFEQERQGPAKYTMTATMTLDEWKEVLLSGLGSNDLSSTLRGFINGAGGQAETTPKPQTPTPFPEGGGVFMAALRHAYKQGEPREGGAFVEELRFRYQTNFQWFNGSRAVTYNKRDATEQARFFPVRHIYINEAIALADLARLVSLSPATGVVGGIDRSIAGNEWWRNHVATGLATTGDTITRMDAAWLACIRNGGRPDFIMAGKHFIDDMRNFLLTTYGQLNAHGFSERIMEAGNSEITFYGVPVIWNPDFRDMDDADDYDVPWEKRCYFINRKHMHLRLDGDSAAITINRGNAHAVLSVA